MTTLVTGGTGWVGRQLLPMLDSPIVVTRNKKSAAKNSHSQTIGPEFIQADLNNQLIAPERILGVKSIVNLMGQSIGSGRWSKSRKAAIRHSRIESTTNLVKSLIEMPQLPDVVISASAVGYYGDRGNDILDEQEPAGSDFLSKLCNDWEHTIQPLVAKGVRVCWIRIGIVLGRGGGALQEMLTPFRLGLGGRLGNGQQWMPWIHITDLVNLITHLLNDNRCSGVFNAVSPKPATNAEFTRTFGKLLGRPTIIPVPRLALRLAMGEFGKYLLYSQRAIPKNALSHQFQFSFPNLSGALADILTNDQN